MYDLCIVGGGVSGMCAAIEAATKGMKVIIIEQNKKLGKKLYATGNGKCNLTNLDMDISLKYNSSNYKYDIFLNEVMGENPCDSVINFIESLGIVTYDTKGYVYPLTNQASSVVWAMLDKLHNLGVTIKENQRVKKITKTEQFFNIICEGHEIKSSKLILACGSKSYSKLGGNDSGYGFAEDFGHKIIPVKPALCGLLVKDNLTNISGVRANARASVICEGMELASEYGELQLTDYGLSGIMIFNLSSKIGKLLDEKKTVSVKINFLPELKEIDIRTMYQKNKHRTIVGFLNGFINDKLASYIISKNKIDTKTIVEDIKYDIIENIINQMQNFNQIIIGTKDFDNAQVCSGGVCLDEVSPTTMMSNLVSGLYIVGELLDIDGLCGGYNLTFAILSGLKAGKSANDKTKSN